MREYRENLTEQEIEDLKSVLEYNPDNGNFYWLKTTNSRAVKGSIAGYNKENEYRTLQYNKVRYIQHRLAFLFMTGKFPKDQVDHKNRIKSDNRWCNLREATRIQNSHNIQYKFMDKTSKYRGVYLDRGICKVKIELNKKKYYLGRFNTEEEAALAYDEKAKELHGDFAVLNFK